MSMFPKARPTKAPRQKLPRRPRDWRARTHVCIITGVVAHDGIPICGDCGMRCDHRIHDLNQDIVLAASEIDQRKLGESP